MSRPTVAVLDYEAGNVRSAQRAIEHAGADAFITSSAEAAGGVDALVIPGVGHFATCLANLRRTGLEALVRDWIAADRHVLGICVGMQLLYEHSEEGDAAGLDVLPGRVLRLPDDAVVPHIGWDVVAATSSHRDDPLVRDVDGQRTYFVHSYYAQPVAAGNVVATCSYGGVDFPCLVRVGNVVGTQFHPEKSGTVGGQLMRNWVAQL